MNGMIKKYLPFALIIFGVYLLVPLIFLIPGLNNFSAVAYYFIFLVTQVACSAFYCSKHGLDFLFALIAPIAFLFTMMIYAGGFTNFTNIILLVVYLIAGKQAAEELLLQAKRRDERERELHSESGSAPQRTRTERPRRPQQSTGSRYAQPSRAAQKDSDDDFYSRYTADMDKELDERVNRLLDED